LLDTDAKLDLQQFFHELSYSRDSVLLLDYDGTLAPFCLNRDEAHPYPGVPMLLNEIINTGHSRVVVISGRPAGEIVPLLGVVPHPEIWGVHGLERLNPDGSREMTRLDEVSIDALAEADSWLGDLGLQHLAEHKPGSVAVHWRGLHSGEQSDICKIVRLRWSPVAHRAGMILQEFDGGIEMRAPNCNKANAVRTVLSGLEPDTPVAYLGDDETDEDAFLALSGRGLRVLVRQEWRQTRADLWLQPPAELQVFLCDWLDACQTARRRTLPRAC